MAADDQSDQQSIAKLAYLLWESRGRPSDSAEQDWLEAEAMFAASQARGAIPVTIERRKSRAKKTAPVRESRRPNSP
jgi:hypothetical protein